MDEYCEFFYNLANKVKFKGHTIIEKTNINEQLNIITISLYKSLVPYVAYLGIIGSNFKNSSKPLYIMAFPNWRKTGVSFSDIIIPDKDSIWGRDAPDHFRNPHYVYKHNYIYMSMHIHKFQHVLSERLRLSA